MASDDYRLLTEEFTSFFDAPFNAYNNISLYVSPFKSDLRRFLDREQNPLFKHFGEMTYFSILKAGRPIGRITAHIHRSSNEQYGLKRCYFGFFDCANDSEAATRLLDAVQRWAKDKGCNEIAGNFNLTAMQQIGVMVGGFENAPYTDQVYNPPHIPSILEQNGYQRFFPMSTFELELRNINADSLLRPEQKQSLEQNATLHWRLLRKRGFNQLMLDTCKVLNDGFANNPMFVPLTDEEFMFQAREMMWVIDQRISPIVYANGEPVGVIVCIPDLNPLLKSTRSRLSWRTPFSYLKFLLHRKRAVIIFYSVVHAHHGKGLNTMMLSRLIGALQQCGYTHLGITWIADVNKASLRQMEKIGANKLHELCLFRKSI